MSFFSRPNLENLQFKQLRDSELTLSGQTQIATISGLTLIGDAGTGPPEYGGMYIPIIATGAINNFVLTYDDIQKAIILKESTASGGSTVYTATGATTCSVGGLSAGTTVYNCTLDTVLQCILNPTLYPDLITPSVSSFTISPTTTIYERGTSISITGTTCVDLGSINPQYSSASSCRSSCATSYDYVDFSSPVAVPASTASQKCIQDVYIFSSSDVQTSNTLSVKVTFDGGVQPKDSSGDDFDSPLLSGCTSYCSKTITGIYPWYWGTVTCAAAAGVGRPSACCIKDIVTGGTSGTDYCKVVGVSNNTLNVVFNSTPDDYIWFATPNASTTKTCWFVNTLNSGIIGGAVSAGGNLFPDPDTSITNMCSCDGYWDSETYKIYVSNKQTSATQNMQLRNF